MFQYQVYVTNVNYHFFSYSSKIAYPIGTWVVVPFGKQQKLALIVQEESISHSQKILIKAITKCATKLAMPEAIVETILWAAEYYAAKFSDFVTIFYPSSLDQKSNRVILKRYFIPQNHDEEQLLQAFSKKTEITLATLKKYVDSSVIDQLIAKKLLEKKVITKQFVAKKVTYTHEKYHSNIVLSPEQDQVFNTIIQSKKSRFLIHGITGSGKTAIYIRLIEAALNDGCGALFLVPEISLTTQMIDTLEKTFPNQIAILHSKLSQTRYRDEWLSVYQGDKRIVLGVRSAIFAPIKNLGMIIIDEEHETTYKQDNAPFYHTKFIALRRAMHEKSCKLVLGSATPSVESYYFASQHYIELLELHSRYQDSTLPTFTTVDMTNERGIISQVLIKKITEKLEKKEQIILFLNRRGFAKYIQCQACGFTEKCPHCSITLSYSKFNNTLSCHYCGFSKKYQDRCTQCSSHSIVQYNYGIEKISERITALFPNAKLALADSESITSFEAYQTLYRDFLDHKIDILIGTQIISKGFHFPNLTLVGIINADNILNFPDFRASEKTFHVLLQVSGRSGREAKAGEVVVQTHSPEHYAVELAQSERNFKAFYDTELNIRKELLYPPFGRIILLNISSLSESDAFSYAEKLYFSISNNKNLEIFGPIKSPIFKLRDRYRFQIFIKGDKDAIDTIKPQLLEMKQQEKNIRLLIDVDPINFM